MKKLFHLRLYMLIALVQISSSLSTSEVLAQSKLPPGSYGEDFGTPLMVVPGNINIRSADGVRKCQINKKTLRHLIAVGRHADGERIKVNVSAPGCPSEGYIYSNFVRPLGSEEESNKDVVDTYELALRKKPHPRGLFTCGLKKNSEVKILAEGIRGAATSSWVKVEVVNPPKGCPKEGFVNGSYLKPAHDFTYLPIADESRDERADKPPTEADICTTGTCAKPKGKDNLGDIKKILDVATAEGMLPKKGSFWDGLMEMIRNPKTKNPPAQLATYRGLVQLPLEGNKGNVAPCGAHHYSPDKPIGVDVYTNPLTACAFMSVLQDWKKNACPGDDEGCTIAFGDISHKTRPQFNGHRSHTEGQCLDIRPLNKGPFNPHGRSYREANYDGEKTKELIQKLKAAGGSNIYFNDRSAGGTRAGGHSDHIHVCFKKNSPKVQETCNNFVPDFEICPELK